MNIVPNLKISTEHCYVTDFITTDDQITQVCQVTYNFALKKIKIIDTAKASQQSDIPSKILKQNSDYFAEYFKENINWCISK